MPHYLARESNEQKGGKGVKKSGGGVKNGQQKKLTHCLTMIAIAIRVLNQGISRGWLQLVEKVEV